MTDEEEVELDPIEEEERLERKANEEHLDYQRRQSEADFFYFAREILGYTDSIIEWYKPPDDPVLARNPKNWTSVRDVRDGPDYGISRTGPHKQMADLLLSPIGLKHLEAPRGSYKTTMTLCWLIWKTLFDRNLRVLYLMDTMTEAKKKVFAIRNTVEKNEKLRELWPDYVVASRGEKGAFTVGGRTKAGIVDPTFEAGGVDSDMTGSHRDIIVMDDAVNFLNVRTKEGIGKTRAYFDMAQPLLDPGGIMLVIGTRYDDSDLYGDIIRDMSTEVGGPWECLILDCGMELEVGENKQWHLVGKPIFAHLTKEVLHYKLATMDHSRFASQYLNRCLAGSMQVFSRHHFRFQRFDPLWMRNLRYHILTDNAVSEADTSCYSVVGVVGLDAADNAYLVDLRVGRWPPQNFAPLVCDMIEQWQGQGCSIAQVCIEKVSLTRTFKANLESEMHSRQMRTRITDTARGVAEGSKDQRIASLAMRFTQGRFYVCDTVPMFFNDGTGEKLLFDPGGWQEAPDVKLPAGELVDEFIRFPVARFKDIPDALSDIDAYGHDGRVCHGCGKKEDLKEALAVRAGRKPKLRKRPKSYASKWDALAERTQRPVWN